MYSMMMYHVGDCIPQLALGYDGCMMQFLGGMLHMYALIDRPTADMLCQADFDQGAIELGLVAVKDVITVALKMGALPWMDAPYSVHLGDLKDLPEKNAETLQMNLLLVDSSDGRIPGIRTLGLSRDFSVKLLLEMKKQIQRLFDVREYRKQVFQLQAKYTPEQIGTEVCLARHVTPSRQCGEQNP